MSEKKSNTTIHDIAKVLNVSASTVSRALNDHPKISDATKTKVKEVALNLGYAQNVSTALRQEIIGKTVGVIVPSLNETKYSLLVESCRKELESKGFQVVVCCSSDSIEQERNVVRLLDNLDVHGVVASLTSKDKNPDYFHQLVKKRPVVLFDRVSFEMPCHKIMIDHFQAGFRAVQHLLNIGSKKIAHLGGDINCPLSKQISTGYKTAVRNGGLKVNPKMELFSDFLYEDVMKAIELLFNAKELPDAILVDNIMAAQKLVSVLQTRKIIIPDQVAIVAIGDERDYSYYSPSITTVQLPYKKVGRNAAKVLLEQMEGGKSSVQGELLVEPFHLNIRNSTLKR